VSINNNFGNMLCKTDRIRDLSTIFVDGGTSDEPDHIFTIQAEPRIIHAGKVSNSPTVKQE
jgi:hypothetical protein